MDYRNSRNTSTIKRRMGVLGLKDSLEDQLSKAYDSDKGELWGRNAERWALLVVFYVVFYSCLIGFCYAMGSFWYWVIVNRDSPKYSGDDSLLWTPGVSHIPIFDTERKSTLLHFTRSNGTQIDQIKDDIYFNFLKSYEKENYVSENGNYIECRGFIRTRDDPELVCEFDLDLIHPCIYEDDYGYADGQPCIILKMNKINDWIPENFEPEEVPDEIKDVWEKDFITVKCFGEDPVSRERMGEINYYPKPGFSFIYFPFTGQQGYKSPIVAVQFMSLPQRVAIFITCKAYSKNMVYSETRRFGLTKFEVISD